MEFNSALVTGLESDHERLALEIANFVDADSTDPQPPSLREGWESDLAIRNLEKDAGHHKCNWSWLSDVCGRAALKCKSLSGRALVLMEQLGSERRLSLPSADVVMRLAAELETLIAGLDGPRKDRLSSLLDYNLGIYARETENYELAANLQIKLERLLKNSDQYKQKNVRKLTRLLFSSWQSPPPTLTLRH